MSDWMTEYLARKRAAERTSGEPHDPRMSMAEFRSLAARSGFGVVKIGGAYRLVEIGTGRRLVNRDGTYKHRGVAELYETLSERM